MKSLRVYDIAKKLPDILITGLYMGANGVVCIRLKKSLFALMWKDWLVIWPYCVDGEVQTTINFV